MDAAIFSVVICEGLLLALGIYFIWSWLTKTPFYPSSSKLLEQIINDKDLNLPKSGRFLDIGSGDGRIVIWAAKKGYDAEGIEFNPFLSLYSRIMIFFNGVGRKATIFNNDFRNHSFKGYDVIYMYIFPEHMDNLKERLFKELPKNSVIITNTFKFKDQKPDITKGKMNVYYVK